MPAIKKFFWLTCVLLFTPGCQKLTKKIKLRKDIIKSRAIQTYAPLPDIPITIYIHGATPFGFIPGLYDSINCPKGFIPLESINPRYSIGRLSRILNDVNPQEFPLEGFFIFGWEGTLSFQARRRAARRLYKILHDLRQNQVYENCPITVIGFSHGSNVALNLARAAREDGNYEQLVDRLVLICCPVQEDTKRYIEASTFKKVFAFMSKGDFIQVLDPQGLYPPGIRDFSCSSIFSQRIFPEAPRLIEAEIKVNQKQLGHFDFLSYSFLYSLPRLLKLLDNPFERIQLPRNENNCYCINIDKCSGYILPCTCKTNRTHLCMKHFPRCRF